MEMYLSNLRSTFLSYITSLVNDSSMNKGDAGAGGIMLATAVNALPTISVILSIVWVSLRIYVLIRDEIINKKEK